MIENVKVLIVDDDEVVCRSFGRFFKKYKGDFSFDIKEAYNGREAVDSTITFQPDLILLDINMPVMDGLQVAREIKNLDTTHRLTMVTSSADPKGCRACQTSQCRYVFDKGSDAQRGQRLATNGGRGLDSGQAAGSRSRVDSFCAPRRGGALCKPSLVILTAVVSYMNHRPIYAEELAFIHAAYRA